MPICLDKAAASYLDKIKAFIVALMQYTADKQDSCSALALEAQPWRGNRSENGWRHAVSNFTCCIYPHAITWYNTCIECNERHYESEAY